MVKQETGKKKKKDFYLMYRLLAAVVLACIFIELNISQFTSP
jgi:hypothetical protein